MPRDVTDSPVGSPQGAAAESPPLPLATMLGRLNLAAPALAPADMLSGVHMDTHVVQDFRPLCESIEWRLATAYWEQSGVAPFVDNSVPYLINNNGRPSERAAAVLLASCLEADHPQAPVAVLEVGAGSGLFARYFLDAFRALCTAQSVPFYDRLTYVVSDHARRTVEQWATRDLFAEHPGRVVLATCDAENPGSLVGLDARPVALPPLELLVCNYVLDVLPAAVVRDQACGPQQLCVRTHLTTNAVEVCHALRILDHFQHELNETDIVCRICGPVPDASLDIRHDGVTCVFCRSGQRLESVAGTASPRSPLAQQLWRRP